MSDAAMSTGYMTPQGLKEQERAAKKAERARLKRVEMDEKAERKRAAKSGFANVSNPRRSKLLTLVCAVFAVYCLFPFVYLLVNATKTQADFTSTFGLGFGHTFALWDNIVTVFTYQDGIFGRWFLNTVLYVVVGAGGATLLAIMGGYGLAKFRFPGRKAVFAVIIGAWYEGVAISRDLMLYSAILLAGFGPVGQALGVRLAALGAQVTVAARRPVQRALAESFGLRAVDLARLEQAAPAFDTVVNTIPAPVLTEAVLAALRPGSLIVDLASKPGGTDFAAARRLGHRAIHALSLPTASN